MNFRLTSTKMLISGFVLIFISIACIVFVSLSETNQEDETSRLIDRTGAVLFRAERILSGLSESENDFRSFLLTDQRFYIDAYNKSKDEFAENISFLRRLLTDQADDQFLLDSLSRSCIRHFIFLDSILFDKKQKDKVVLLEFVDNNKSIVYLNSIKQIVWNIQGNAKRLLEQKKQKNKELDNIQEYTLISIALVLLILLLLTFWKMKLIVAEEARRRSELTFKGLLESAPDAIVIVNDKGEIVLVNRQTELMFGYAKSELIGKNVELLIPEDLRFNHIHNRELFMKHPEPRTMYSGRELTALRKNAEHFPVEISLSPFKTEKHLLISAAVRDITERKKAQGELISLLFQIDQSHDAIFTVDADLNIRSWNKGAEELYGFKREIVIGQYSMKYLDNEATADEIIYLVNFIAENNNWTGERKRRSETGEIMYVRTSISAIKNEVQEIKGYIAVSFDITRERELRNEVNHLASIVEQSTEAIISVDINNKIISWNSGAERMHGYSREEVIGKSAREIGLIRLPGDILDAEFKSLFERGSLNKEMEILHKNGSTFVGLLNANLIKDEHGKINSIVFIINDISVRKLLEEQLKRYNVKLEEEVRIKTEAIASSEKRYRYMFEHNPMPMWVYDIKTFNFLDVNDMAVLQYGYSREEFLLMTVKDIRPESDLELFLNVDHIHGIGNEDHKKGIWKHLKKDGNIIQVEIIAFELFYEGIPARFVLANDITEKKKAADQLIASEKQFRTTLDNMLEGVQIIDFNYRYIYVNEALCKQTSYSKADLVGHTVMEKFPAMVRTELFRVYKRCFEERISIHLEHEVEFKDGSTGWFELSFQPVPEGIFILSIDKTKKRRAEEELIKSERLYRNLFGNLLHGFAYCKAILDEEDKLMDYIYLAVNSEYEIQTGLRNITGKKISEILPRLLSSIPAYAQAIERVAITGRAEKIETYFEILDQWFSISMYSTAKDHFVCLLENITERKQVEQKIKLLNIHLEERVVRRTEQLKKTNDELEAFTYSVSHDLRAPLRAIIGFTAILEEEYSSKMDAEASRITAIIKSNTIKMGNLIDDLLSFSRTGRQEIYKTTIHTVEMIKEIIAESVNKLENNEPEWIISELPEIKADPNTMRQVWINLISNAIKYSKGTTNPKIEIGFERKKDEIIFYIRDNGVGFDEKYKDKLFKVFQRLHSTAEFEGTGVGLAIVEKIICRHQGKVWATANPGKGACFYFSLPVD